MRIFIVEDETEIVEFYAEVIQLCGHEVMGIAANGRDAVEQFSRFSLKPDAIIMDHRMPVMSGLQAAKEILRIDPGAKIIFASADRSVETEALQIGVVSFKKKPFTLDRLEANIKKLEKSLCST